MEGKEDDKPKRYFKMKYYFFYIIAGVTLLFTIISFFPNLNRSFFIGGSAESLTEIIAANILIKIALLFIAIYFLFRVLNHFNAVNFSFLVFAFFLWLMSGRTIGVLPDGKIKTGWFYFETNELNLCKDSDTDCQTITDYQTTAEKRFFWKLELKNKQVDHNIFIGPIVWHKALKVLRRRFGAGKYTGSGGNIGNVSL